MEIKQEDNSLELNIAPENLPYIGNKWGGKYLRAPEIYFKILEKGKGKLVRLGDIAEVRRGFTTGANEFFYLKPVELTVKEMAEIAEKKPDKLIKVKNGAGWEGEIEAKFLKPVIKSPRELKNIIVKLEDLNYLVFMCHKSEKELKGTKAYEYIKWGEKQETKYNVKWCEVPSVGGRRFWYELEENDSDSLIIPRTFNDIYICYYGKVNYSDRFYGVISKESKLLMFLNSSLFVFLSESLAKQGLGLGALDLNIRELIKIPIVVQFKNFYNRF